MPDAAAHQPGDRVLARSAWALWLLAGPLLWLGLYRPFASDGARAAQLPAAVPGWTWLGAADPRGITAAHLRQLGTDDAVYRTYVSTAPGTEPVIFTAVFHSANWKSVHPPQICLQGSGMTVAEDGSLSMARSDGTTAAAGRILATLDGPQGPYPEGSRYLSYYVYGGVDMLTASYRTFFLHHLPRALFRQSTDGFLLRVETFVGSDGLAAAEERCRSFMDAILPAAQESLR